MQLVIPYSSGDALAASRLIKWIGFLSSRYANSMKEISVLLLASPRAARLQVHQEILALAPKVFGESLLLVPPVEKEVGWPGSANWMFAQALLTVEKEFQDDLFWLEPDAVPLMPTWWDEIGKAWAKAESAGAQFMGNLVPHSRPHMTGIAVYGRNWREFAPSLVECPDTDAFDTFSGPEVLAHARITPLIQHVFKRHEHGWRVPGLEILDRRAVIFHQDKHGRLIRLLDHEAYHGDCAAHPVFNYKTADDKVMMKFYLTANATKSLKSHGRVFKCEPLEPFGGAVPGIYVTESDAEQAALDDLVNNPASGVNYITQD